MKKFLLSTLLGSSLLVSSLSAANLSNSDTNYLFDESVSQNISVMNNNEMQTVEGEGWFNFVVAVVATVGVSYTPAAPTVLGNPKTTIGLWAWAWKSNDPSWTR
jgi:hypothetical protein